MEKLQRCSNLKAVCSVSEIEGLRKRLSRAREELETHLILGIREKVDALTIEQEKDFSALTESVQRTLRNCQETLETSAHSEEIETLSQSNDMQHEKTRAAILGAMYQDEASSVEASLSQSLRFPQMHDRHHEISESHENTFRWIFDSTHDTPVSKRPWSNFVEWLEQRAGVYWINGKAGSGKSTLMRYIVDNPETANHLKTWSEMIDLEIGHFFFWNSGSTEQRSHSGLLRSILHGILRKHPGLLPLVFPCEWADECSHKARAMRTDRRWSLTALREAFNRLTNFAITSLNLCFFIDGLDEYEGDHESMAEFLKSAATSSHVKLCLSNRPWLVFEDAFQGLPELRLQDLTFDDIRLFVADRLEAHHRMRRLSKEEPDHASELVQEIVSKADGVFLWVVLVVRDLLSSLMNRDGISDLRRRLQALPSELGLLYEHMLGHVEPFYQEQASRTFQIYDAMLDDQNSVSALELGIGITATTQIAIDTPYSAMSNLEIQDKCERLDAHLKSRCAGLLELRESHGGSVVSMENGYNLKVNYLHRTVKDFLNNDDVRTMMLRQATNDSEFEPKASVVLSIIFRLKQMLYWPQFWKRQSFFSSSSLQSEQMAISDSDEKIIRRNLRIALMYAKKSNNTATRPGNIALLDELDRVGSHWIPRSKSKRLCSHWSDFGKPPKQQGGFLAEAASSGLVSYVSGKLKTNRELLLDKKKSQSLLKCVLQQPVWQHRPIDLDMLNLLLTSGVDPNQLWDGQTAWQHTLYLLHSTEWDNFWDGINATQGLQCLRQWVEVFAILFQHGASPRTTCIKNHLVNQRDGIAGYGGHVDCHKVIHVITDIFQDCLPDEAAQLRRIVERLEEEHARSAIHDDLSTLEFQRPARKRSIEMAATGPRKRWKGRLSDGIER